MRKTEIYYFTVTGNSFTVARDIANRLNGKLIPIVSLIDQDSIQTKSDVIGIVFPIYDFKAPELVITFINKLKNLESKYIFAVCTYGVMPLKTMKKLNKIITANRGMLSGGFTVKIPHNGIGYNKISISK
jgi:flavodoxin